MNLRPFFSNNSWWGRLVGAFFGYLMAGPIGALFGLLIGNFFDRGLNTFYTRPHWHFHAEKHEEVQTIFFKSTFAVMGHIAKADGRVSEQEIITARILMDDMRLSRTQKNLAKHCFNEGKQVTFNLPATLTNLQSACRDNSELLKLFIDIQYRAAQTDGLSENKIRALDTICRHLGFAPLRDQYRFYSDFGFRNYRNQSSSSDSSSYSYNQHANANSTQSSLAQAYTLLELNQNANKQEVKKAYRRLMSRNHPDKLIAKGLPEAMIKVANDKTQRITKAYEQICESKGW